MYSTKWNVVASSATYTPGTNITLSVSGSAPFRGILLIPTAGTIPSPVPLSYRVLVCTANNALTHSDADDKGPAVSFTFVPPAAGTGSVTITAIVYGSRDGAKVCDYFGKEIVLTEAPRPTPRPTPGPTTVPGTPRPSPAPTPTTTRAPSPATPPTTPTTPRPTPTGVGPTTAPTPAPSPPPSPAPSPTPAPVFMGDVVVLARHGAMRVTKIDPGDEFSAQSFSESALAPAFGPIGFGYDPAAFNATKFGGSFTVGTTDLFIRSTVTLSQAQYDQMQGAILKVAVDDSADLWVRGVVIDTSASMGKQLVASYFTQTFTLPKDKFAVGPNIIAAHVVNLATTDKMLYDLEVVLVFPRPGTTAPTVPGQSTTAEGSLAPGAVCAPGTSGCVCKLMNKCDASEATCDDGICLIRGCVKGEAGCPCLADNTCIGVGRECRNGHCVFPNSCPMPGLEAGCQCTPAGACVGTSASPLKCVVASDICLNVRQYTCNPGDHGCWCKNDGTCATDDSICVDKGFGRKSCVFKVLSAPPVDVTVAASTVYMSALALLAAVAVLIH